MCAAETVEVVERISYFIGPKHPRRPRGDDW